MKRKITILTILLFSFMFSSNMPAQEVWKITSLNWEPYSGAELSHQGNSIQKLKTILASNGITLLVEFYPWKRAQDLAKTKDYIGYFPAWPEEVMEGFEASPPVDWSQIAVLKNRTSSLEFKTIDDLFKNYKVGIIKTYVYPAEINSAMLKYPQNVDDTPNEISLVKKLSKGRNQAAITDPNVMNYIAEKEGLANIETVKILMKKELVISLRKGSDNTEKINLIKKILNSN
jgi:polar amino acid transport system substrate-binding protein